MSIEMLNRVKALEARTVEQDARIEKLEAYIWGEEVNDDLETLEHGAVPHRKRGRPRKVAAEA